MDSYVNVLEPFDSLKWQQWDYRKTDLFLGAEQRREIIFSQHVVVGAKPLEARPAYVE